MRRRMLTYVRGNEEEEDTYVIPLKNVVIGQVWVLTKKGKIVKVIGKSLCVGVWVWVWVCLCVCGWVGGCVFALYIYIYSVYICIIHMYICLCVGVCVRE
jgi:uncharacterized membrane protein YqaE (UPF0057 family)